MSASVIEELKRRAEIVKEEEAQGANNAPRIGSLFYDTLNYEESISGGSQGEKTSVTVTPKYSGGTEVAVINVDGLRTSISAPSPIAPTPYDDTWIGTKFGSIDETIRDFNNALATAQETINTESNKLDGVVQEINTTISDKVNHLEEEANWIHNMFPEGEVSWQSGWDDKVEAYLQRVGVWARNNGITETQWSNISQKVDSLELSVNNTKEYVSGEVEALSSSVTQQVTDYVASLRLDTSYAKKDATEKIIEWMYSAIKSESSAATTFNQIYSAGQAGMNSAIAEIRTQVDKLDNGDYVATADMETKVNDSISGLYQSASATESETNLFSQVKYEKGKVKSWNDAGVILKTNMDSALATMYAEGTQTRAGVILKSTLNKSVASLIATGANDTKAAIEAVVDNGIRQINLTADQINAATKRSMLMTDSLYVRTGSDEHQSLVIKGDTVNNTNSVTIDASRIYILSEDNHGELSVMVPEIYYDGFDKCNIGSEGSGDVTLECGAGYNIYLHPGEDDSEVKIKGNLFFEKGATIHSNSTLELASTDVLFITTSDNLEIQSHKDITMSANSILDLAAIDVMVEAVSFSGDVPYTVSSDERLKDIQRELNPSIEDIAEARIVNYTLKNKENKKEFLGSIAQDWQKVLPNAITKDKEGYLGLDYGSAALASAVTAAREIVTLKEENRLLKERIERLERLIEAK